MGKKFSNDGMRNLTFEECMLRCMADFGSKLWEQTRNWPINPYFSTNSIRSYEEGTLPLRYKKWKIVFRDRSLFMGRGAGDFEGALIFGKSPRTDGGALIFGKSPMGGHLFTGVANF